MKTFLTVREFAQIVQKNKRTVHRWITNGKIPGIKRVGNAYQIPVREVQVYRSASHYPVSK